jgi:hypothetical protein
MEMENSPIFPSNKLVCVPCDYYCRREYDFKIHCATAKHKKHENGNKMETENSPNSFMSKKKNCDVCNYTCGKDSDFKKHINSLKHINSIKHINNDSSATLTCIRCNKVYKTNSGLWKHNKTCTLSSSPVQLNDIENLIIEEPSDNEFKILAKLILEVVKSNSELQKQCVEYQKQNHDLQKQVIDVCKNVQTPTPTTVNTNTININKTFNLQFFLNEQCKNAMNLTDFVDSFNLNLDDLERVCREGYAEGIAYIILEKLRGIDIYKRPIHCSDAKRDSMYVKMDDVWSKEGSNYDKMTIAVKNIGQKNFMLLNEFRKLHPDCLNYDSEHNDHYSKLVMNAAGGCIKENILKIIRLIAKEVVIEK